MEPDTKIAAGIIVGFAVLVLVVGAGHRSPTLSSPYQPTRAADYHPPVTSARENFAWLPTEAEAWIRANLRDPSGAEFRGTVVGKYQDVACGWINARNGFGGLSGFVPFAAVKDNYLGIGTDDVKETAVRMDCKNWNLPLD